MIGHLLTHKHKDYVQEANSIIEHEIREYLRQHHGIRFIRWCHPWQLEDGQWAILSPCLKYPQVFDKVRDEIFAMGVQFRRGYRYLHTSTRGEMFNER